MPKPTPFRTPAAFRAWLARHHDCERELIVRCCKVHAHDRGLTYREALDEALCFGWIDGVRRSVDEDSFSVRFTPRKPRSFWSKINVKRARELEADGRLAPPGLAAFRARDEERSVRRLFVRIAARRTGSGTREEAASKPTGVGILPGAAAVVQADQCVLGDERQAR